MAAHKYWRLTTSATSNGSVGVGNPTNEWGELGFSTTVGGSIIAGSTNETNTATSITLNQADASPSRPLSNLTDQNYNGNPSGPVFATVTFLPQIITVQFATGKDFVEYGLQVRGNYLFSGITWLLESSLDGVNYITRDSRTGFNWAPFLVNQYADKAFPIPPLHSINIPRSLYRAHTPLKVNGNANFRRQGI